jgi:hypothetical protein
MKLFKHHIFPIAVFIAFTLFFTFDIYTLRRAFLHPDIFTYYYPYRHWFLQQLLSGHFPLWNPYWGIGATSEVWASFPVDIYTPIELILGPQYHFILVFQLLLFLYLGFWALRRLGFETLVATAGIIFYFMTPWVSYFYFYFLVINSHIANFLLFTLTFLWFKTEDRKYLYLTSLTFAISMIGTKIEFWFFNTILFIFYAVASAALHYRRNIIHMSRQFLLLMCSMVVGLIANLWQINILVRVMQTTDRLVAHSMSNIFSWEMYHNLFMSVRESDLMKILLICLLVYGGVILRGTKKWISLVLGLVLFAVGGDCGFQLWKSPILVSFMKSPLVTGAAIGLFVSLALNRNRTFADYAGAFCAFYLFVYYWCRPGPGNLQELETVRIAPTAFKVLTSALVFIGCVEFSRNKLARMAYLTVLFVLLMRDQGQIIMAYLGGILWIPTRDNFLIELGIAVTAAIGLSSLCSGELRGLFKRYRNILCWVIPCIVIALSVFPSSKDFYRHHWLMQKVPEDYPYYKGIPKVRNVISELKKEKPLGRIFIFNAWGSIGGAYGFESCLLEGIGRVEIYTSLLPKAYKDWSIFQRLGIRPEQRWGAYTGDYNQEVVARLPKRNYLGYDIGQVYFYSLRAVPPAKDSVFRLLGVNYVLKLFPTFGNERIFLESERDIEEIFKDLGLINVREKNGILMGEFPNPLPRVFTLTGITERNIEDFKNNIDQVVSRDNRYISTEANKFEVGPAVIEQYEFEKVVVSARAVRESYIVLTDLFHPFWRARIDGVETEIIPAFTIFRAVKLPPGEHRVEFYCRVPYLALSIVISAMTFLALIPAFISFTMKERGKGPVVGD